MRISKKIKRVSVILIMAAFFCVSCAWADGGPFQGDWSYEQTCGWQHIASVHLSQNGKRVEGTWSDGSARASGSDGKLKGTVMNGRLYVRYCGGDESSGFSVCPAYDAVSSDYFVREGDDLAWYQMIRKENEKKFRRYMLLHPAVNGYPLVKDDHCHDQ